MLDSEWQLLLQESERAVLISNAIRFLNSMLPLDQPAMALRMFDRWISNEAL